MPRGGSSFSLMSYLERTSAPCALTSWSRPNQPKLQQTNPHQLVATMQAPSRNVLDPTGGGENLGPSMLFSTPPLAKSQNQKSRSENSAPCHPRRHPMITRLLDV